MISELETVIKQFCDRAREEYGNDSYAAGYFASWVKQFGERSPKYKREIIRQLRYTMIRGKA